MEFIIIVIVIFAIFVLPPLLKSIARNRAMRAAAGGFGAFGGGGIISDFYSLLQYGETARGILLKVGTQRSAQGSQANGYYEVISVRIDVEREGQSPYECDCQLGVPASLRPLVLPGATVELRVDPNNRNNIAVYGPGVGLPAAG